jgi:hypothetical protein
MRRADSGSAAAPSEQAPQQQSAQEGAVTRHARQALAMPRAQFRAAWQDYVRTLMLVNQQLVSAKAAGDFPLVDSLRQKRIALQGVLVQLQSSNEVESLLRHVPAPQFKAYFDGLHRFLRGAAQAFDADSNPERKAALDGLVMLRNKHLSAFASPKVGRRQSSKAYYKRTAEKGKKMMYAQRRFALAPVAERLELDDHDDAAFVAAVVQKHAAKKGRRGKTRLGDAQREDAESIIKHAVSGGHRTRHSIAGLFARDARKEAGQILEGAKQALRKNDHAAFADRTAELVNQYKAGLSVVASKATTSSKHGR